MAQKNGGKIAICFWGLTRSLKYTINSIKKCIFEPLSKSGIVFDIYLHTYIIDGKYSNPRAKEDVFLDNEEYKLLKPTYYKIENQSVVSKKINFEKYKSMANPWALDSTFNFHLLALWSLQQVTKLWSLRSEEYSNIMYCRPDVEYLCPIDIRLLQQQSNDIYITNFAHFANKKVDQNKFGMGADRFAIGKPQIMKIYGNRFDEAYIYSKTRELYSRTFLEDTLNKHNIKIKFINFTFIRIRANGRKSKKDAICYKKTGCATRKNHYNGSNTNNIKIL
jgi:hypothetical protein